MDIVRDQPIPAIKPQLLSDRFSTSDATRTDKGEHCSLRYSRSRVIVKPASKRKVKKIWSLKCYRKYGSKKVVFEPVSMISSTNNKCFPTNFDISHPVIETDPVLSVPS